MDMYILKNEVEGGKKAAEIIKEVINEKNDAVLGLATGSTPIEMYKALIEMYKNGEVSFKNVKSVNLDEYVGLAGDHEQSYRYFMDENLFNHVDIDKNNTYVPNGLSKDFEKEAIEYEKLIEKLGRQDCQVLGVGKNGHIGFNEPHSELNAVTHVEDLTESTIDANKRFFESVNDVPKKAISMGMGSILKARKIILLAFGEAKADVIKSLEDSIITPQIPVTLLKLHPDVTVIVNEAAASKLR